MTRPLAGRAAAILALSAAAAACSPPGATYTGRVTFADGRPVQGMEIDVGGMNANSQGAGTSAQTDSDGRYAMHMGPGRYHVTYGMYKLSYHGQPYTLGMDQTSGPTDDVEAKGRITSDFVVRTHGVVSKVGDMTDPNNFFGGTIQVDPDVSTPWFGQGWPKGSSIELVLTPTGPLIDGSAGKTLTLTQPTTDTKFRDIPVGEYMASVRLIQPGAAAVQAQGHQWFTTDNTDRTSIRIDFPPLNRAIKPNGGSNAGVARLTIKPA